MSPKELDVVGHRRRVASAPAVHDTGVTLRPERDALEDLVERRHQGPRRDGDDDEQRAQARQDD